MRSFFQKKILFFFFLFQPSNYPRNPLIRAWNSVSNYSVNRLHFSRWRGEEVVGSDAIKELAFFSSRGLSNFYSRKPGLMPLRYSSVCTRRRLLFSIDDQPRSTNAPFVDASYLLFKWEKRISSFRITIQLSRCTPSQFNLLKNGQVVV